MANSPTRGVLGMRAKDLQKFLMVARDYNVTILVRQTNEAALKYIGQRGYYPKPAVCKAKTADQNPRPIGATTLRTYDVAGLVVHPAFHPSVYGPAKMQKAQDCWDHTMEVLSPQMMHKRVDPYDKQSCAPWGVERKGAGAASRWSWRVDIDPNSPRFGCLQLRKDGIEMSYIHGDYDLKDVVVDANAVTRETNIRHKKLIDGVPNNTPFLFGLPFETIQARLNALIGSEMVQHGAEAQFAWHGDEAILVAYPDWTHCLLMDPLSVQNWYTDKNRRMHAKGTDYGSIRSRMFHFGPNGMFAPGAMPGRSWG